MKKILITLLFSVIIIGAYAQLTVDSIGRVVIGDECLASNKLKIGEESAISISAMKTNVSSILRSCNGEYNVSLYGETYPGPLLVNVPLAGVCGLAGNGLQGNNYGTMGLLYGFRDGAGVYGATVYYSSDLLTTVPGRYAGYFKGNVYVDGIMHINGYQTMTNDTRLYHNIRPLGSSALNTDVISNILKIKAYEYNIETEAINADSIPDETFDEEEAQRLHFGFSAEELIKIYPSLVRKTGDGYLAINYNEIIPLLIISIQQLNQELEELKKKIDN